VKYLKNAVKKKEASEEESTSKSWQSFLNKVCRPHTCSLFRRFLLASSV
jgi:hypothetical protein